MLKIETKEGRVIVSGTSAFSQSHQLASLIEELKKAQNKMIEEQEKKALSSDNFYELWES